MKWGLVCKEREQSGWGGRKTSGEGLAMGPPLASVWGDFVGFRVVMGSWEGPLGVPLQIRGKVADVRA